MTFPQIFDAYVPSNTLDFLALSRISPGYVPFETLRAVPLDIVAPATFAYAKRITPPTVFVHVLRTFYFALSLLYNGFHSALARRRAYLRRGAGGRHRTEHSAPHIELDDGQLVRDRAARGAQCVLRHRRVRQPRAGRDRFQPLVQSFDSGRDREGFPAGGLLRPGNGGDREGV
ncbi:hypothetical protein B0H14DRAFT_2942694 [Mycena olivaceomarginata]|nr:hypothetical protein B0H14DRAFT_2942694 [Mycena olivaceomarginata]